jgi:hypothetical protein
VTQRTIPDDVLDKIAARWPHLTVLIDGLRANPNLAGRYELELANNIPAMQALGPLTILEWTALCKCSAREPYGQYGEWLTMPQAATRLGYEPTTIQRALGARGIPTVERGHKKWVRASDLEGVEKRSPGRPKTTPDDNEA